jgi:thiol-disulfide isomerase/thioredoxin
MKKTIMILLCVQVFLNHAHAEGGITFFNGTFNEALTKAKAEKKLLFLDCYATWCGPCKWMTAHVFTDDKVAKFFNKNFICLASDMEKGEGIDLAKKYGVKNYPTYIWMDDSGKQIQRSVGSTNAESFLTIAENSKDPKKNLAYLKEQYESGNKKPELLLSYANALSEAFDLTSQTIIDEYLMTLSAEELLSEKNWKLILKFTPNINTSIYGRLMQNSKSFYLKYGKDSVTKVFDDLVLKSLSFASQQKDSVMFDNARKYFLGVKDTMTLKAAVTEELNYYKTKKDIENYTKLAHFYVPKYFFEDAKMLNAICWTYFQKVDEKTNLDEAEKWIAQSVKLDDQYYNTDTYANLLSKIGKKNEAIEMAKHSIEVAKKSAEDYSSTEELLNDLQKGN